MNTYKGDFLRISLSKNEDGRIRSKERKLMNLVSIEGEIIDLTMVEKEDERLTFICFNECYSMGFSSENHDVIDHFMVHNGECFTAIESAILDEDQIILFYGTQSGNILIRENWSEEPHVVQIEGEISYLKLAHSLTFLVAVTTSNQIHILR